eukprot:766610-Hanusia_phi.AAC.2
MEPGERREHSGSKVRQTRTTYEEAEEADEEGRNEDGDGAHEDGQEFLEGLRSAEDAQRADGSDTPEGSEVAGGRADKVNETCQDDSKVDNILRLAEITRGAQDEAVGDDVHAGFHDEENVKDEGGGLQARPGC